MKRYLSLIILAAGMATQGCSDFLDTIPDNRTEIDDSEKVTKLLANAYPRITYTGLLEGRCDQMTDFGATRSGSQQTESFEFMRAGFYWQPFVESQSGDSYEGFWEDCYRAVSYANFALEALDKYGSQWDAGQVKAMRAEAKVCRAYAHFMLLALFSDMFDSNNMSGNPGIPYVDVPEDQVFKQYERGTVASTLDRIETDLYPEIDNLPGNSGYAVPQYRFTRNAAIALAVRVALFTKNWSRVIQYADMLLPEAATFEETGGTSIWNTPVRYISQNDNAFTTIKAKLMDWNAYSATGANLYEPGQYFSNPSNSSFLLSTEVNTVTWRAFLGTLLTSYAYSLEEVKNVATVNVTGARWALRPLQLADDNTSFWVKYYEDFLYVDEAAGIGYTYIKTNLFRLEEVLLARAEAKVMLAIEAGQKDMYDRAIDDLNIYLSSKIGSYNYAAHRLDRRKIYDFYSGRWGSDSFVLSGFNQPVFDKVPGAMDRALAQALIFCVMDFRRVEFMFEGMRYFDILRWNIPVTHTRVFDGMTLTLRPDDDNRILQIPEAAQLSGLELNPMRQVAAWPGIRYQY